VLGRCLRPRRTGADAKSSSSPSGSTALPTATRGGDVHAGVINLNSSSSSLANRMERWEVDWRPGDRLIAHAKTQHPDPAFATHLSCDTPANVSKSVRPRRTTRPGMRTQVDAYRPTSHGTLGGGRCARHLWRPDAPLIDERAATRGRGAMEGGDERVGVKAGLSVRAPASRTDRMAGTATRWRLRDRRSG